MNDEVKFADDGGLAFPMLGDPAMDEMTLRDWFAAQALQGILSGTAETAGDSMTPWRRARISYDDWIVRESYACADRMLKERAK